MGVEGRVFCKFTVNRDGSIQDVQVIRGIGAGCDEEAIRVIQSAPAWKPGKQRGRAVRSSFNLAIIFKLN
jgi:protein TonB